MLLCPCRIIRNSRCISLPMCLFARLCPISPMPFSIYLESALLEAKGLSLYINRTHFIFWPCTSCTLTHFHLCPTVQFICPYALPLLSPNPFSLAHFDLVTFTLCPFVLVHFWPCVLVLRFRIVKWFHFRISENGRLTFMER